MIIIDKMSYGRFGNQLLFFNNMIQLSKMCETEWWCPSWGGEYLFSNKGKGNIENFSAKPVKICDSSFFNSVTNTEIKNISKESHIIIREPCLGELFFRFDNFILNEIYKFKNHRREQEEKIAAIHFRGTDFHEWNPKAVLPFSYYKDSINHVLETNKNVIFKLFTDDILLESFQKTLTFFRENNIKYLFGPDSSTSGYMNDFIDMTLCDVIVSTPSTFSICAGFLGKKKYIIHNKEWVESRKDLNDQFWKDLYNGGNKIYNTNKLL